MVKETFSSTRFLRRSDFDEVLDVEDGAAGGDGLREFEVDGRFFFGDLDALDLFEFLDARLHLLGFGGLVAEAVDEDLERVDAFALIFVGVHQLRAALFLLDEVLFVVAVVDVHALVPDLDRFVDGDVEEVAVVRDEDEGVLVGGEVLFEPVAGFEVEVVGRLVEQKERGLLQKELGERDAHLPAAGELFRAALPVFLREAEAGEHGADLRVERVDVMRVEEVGDLGVAVGGGDVLARFRVGLGDGVGELLVFSFERAELVEDREAFVEDGAAGEREAILRQVADGHAFDVGALAVVERLDAGEDLQQRGFAGAVAADEAGALIRCDEPVDVFKEEFWAEAFAGAG